MLKCLLLRKNKTNLFDYVDYQNAGPKMNFLNVSRTLVIDVLWRQSMLQINGRGRNAMHTTSTHNILLENLLCDV